MIPTLVPTRLYKDLDINFPAHPQTGDVGKRIDVNAVKQSILTLLYTQPGERLFQPTLGTPLYRLLFEPIDPIITESLRVGIETAIRNHEPRVILNRVDLVPMPDENAYEISIFFNIIGLQNPVTFTTTLKRLR